MHTFTMNQSSIVPAITCAQGWLWTREEQRLLQVKDRNGKSDEIDSITALMAKAAETFATAFTLRNTEATAKIGDFYLEMMRDPALLSELQTLQEQGETLADAIKISLSRLEAQFAEINDPYIRARAKDISDLKTLLLTLLRGGTVGPATVPDAPFVLVAKTLSVPELLQLPRDHIRGILCGEGNTTAHIAIVARGLGIPGWFGVKEEILIACENQALILDGYAQRIIINPDEQALAAAHHQAQASRNAIRDQEKYASNPGSTRDGVGVCLLANIRDVKEAQAVSQVGAEGVGLFRTELVFSEHAQLPTVDDQRNAYLQVGQTLKNRPWTVRLADIGGDKPHPAVDIGNEMNPFLGIRGWRLLQTHRDLLDAQVRALLEVHRECPLSIMIPMVSHVEEICDARNLIHQQANEMGVSYPAVGMMVEVPSSAIGIRRFLPHTDFVSIGSNDLTQYVFSADRTNADVEHLYQQYHPIILQLIGDVVDACRAAGKEVSVCGELAGDLLGALLLVGLGVTKLSMAPPLIPIVKQELRKFSYHDLNSFSHLALACQSAAEVARLRRELAMS